MGRQGKPMSKEEGQKIVEYLEIGINPNAIATRLHRSSNCVYTYIRNNNLSGKVAMFRPKGKIVDAERPPEKDLSSLPDNVLFKHINWAIPILIVIVIGLSSCASKRKIQHDPHPILNMKGRVL